MPAFDDVAVSAAPVEEVWKLLYDPSRFPEWWHGVDAVVPAAEQAAGDFTAYAAGMPDFPIPQELRCDAAGRHVVVSCLVTDISFRWRLAPAGDDDGTEIAVHVEVPDEEAHRLERQREVIRASVVALAERAAATAGPRARG
jgi:hypothetical protein